MVQRRLGRGLDFLISGTPAATGDEEIVEVAAGEIRPTPFQPRREFGDQELLELAQSIAEHGVLQPVVVRATGEGYELIAGERRFRACLRLGRDAIPAIVRQATDSQLLELALVENVQREDLNPIEMAHAYRALMTTLGLTQDDAAKRVGKSRSAVANTVRLLDLPPEIQERVSQGALSGGHARALLSVPDYQTQRAIADRIAAEGLSVRDTEAAVKRATRPAPKPASPGNPALAPYLHDLEDQLRGALGTRVSIQTRGSGEKGRIVIEYFSTAEFEGLLQRLLGDDRS